MNRAARALAWMLLIGLVLGASLLFGVASLVGPIDPAALIQINGEPVAHLRVADGLGGVLGTLLAGLVILVVVPVAVLLPLVIVALVLVGLLLLALAAVAGVAALVFSPFLLLAGLVWLAWRLGRDERPAHRPAAGATMPG
jgi:hypothetical protein